MTGQRKSIQNVASLSSAVTQGADAYLVKSLQEVGNGKWFKVLERGGLDNLIKERQLIRQMRELYQGKDAQPLPPMLFAGMILEGGIIGYDSNIISGGTGARLLGIGASTEYRQDEVTISLRAVSVATGEVLVTVNVSKTVISFQDKAGVLKFYDLGTRSLELESGKATNESMNKAVQLAIHAGVVELIQQGAAKGHWKFKQ
jgi:curli production assembly/transport component CsgG